MNIKNTSVRESLRGVNLRNRAVLHIVVVIFKKIIFKKNPPY